MLKNIKKDNKGFTIIEVLIVLAIAGLIMLIVFLAVPALQRNSRNTQRKNDVGALLSAVQEYSNNNGGTGPGAVTLSGNQYYFCSSGTCTTTNSSPGKVGYYTTASTSAGATLLTAVPGTAPSVEQVFIIKGATCNGNTPATNSSQRNVVAWWTAEPSVSQCQES